MKNKKPYEQRSDLEKIKSNWVKSKTLLSKKEYSSAVLRAATACEIAANYVIRKALCEDNTLEKEFVDSLLIWSNGLQGKLDRLILPFFKNTPKYNKFKKIKSKISEINKERNTIAHSGQFKKKTVAEKILKESNEAINILVKTYNPRFKLKY